VVLMDRQSRSNADQPNARLVFVCWQGLVDNECIAVPAGAGAQHPLAISDRAWQPGTALAERQDRLAACWTLPGSSRSPSPFTLHLDPTKHGQVPKLHRRPR
jgi:hypothetical protein